MVSPAVIPNVLTVLRMLAVPPLVLLLLTGHYQLALVLVIAASLTDALDGWLARRFGWQSRFGGFADPLADKLLMVASYLTLTWLGYLPVWLLGLVLLRDLVIVAGGVVYHFVFEPVEAAPTLLSRINTVCQVVLVWYVMTHLAGVPLPIEPLYVLMGLVALMTVITLVQYVWIWTFKAVAVSRARSPEP